MIFCYSSLNGLRHIELTGAIKMKIQVNQAVIVHFGNHISNDVASKFEQNSSSANILQCFFFLRQVNHR